jgi:hypothetical protein
MREESVALSRFRGERFGPGRPEQIPVSPPTIEMKMGPARSLFYFNFVLDFCEFLDSDLVTGTARLPRVQPK